MTASDRYFPEDATTEFQRIPPMMVDQKEDGKLSVGDGIAIAGVWFSSAILCNWFARIAFVDSHGWWRFYFNEYEFWALFLFVISLCLTPLLSATLVTKRILGQ